MLRRLRCVDDMHLHVRDGIHLAALGPLFNGIVRRAIIMPNLVPPVTTTEQALAYRQRVLAVVPAGVPFTPLMTLYLTDRTTAEEIHKAKASGHIYGVKLYPAGATTNSDSGVTDLNLCDAALQAMAEIRMPLLVHGEVTDPATDVFDREAVFIERVLRPLVTRHPTLRVVMEHITTRAAVEFVSQQGPNVAATITCQHLLHNRNAIFNKGLRPHRYCLPVLKTEDDRLALLEAVRSGNPKFFMGTDSAPHPRNKKEQACCHAGCFTMHAPVELYATAFAEAGCLDKLEDFCSSHGADFYGLPRNEATFTLKEEEWTVPETYAFGGDDVVVPLNAGETLRYRAGAE